MLHQGTSTRGTGLGASANPVLDTADQALNARFTRITKYTFDAPSASIWHHKGKALKKRFLCSLIFSSCWPSFTLTKKLPILKSKERTPEKMQRSVWKGKYASLCAIPCQYGHLKPLPSQNYLQFWNGLTQKGFPWLLKPIPKQNARYLCCPRWPVELKEWCLSLQKNAHTTLIYSQARQKKRRMWLA